VSDDPVAGEGLDGMAKGVAEVEKRPDSLLFLIIFYNITA
jgi:hypothetical protein